MAFSLKLGNVLHTAPCSLTPSSWDNELELKHKVGGPVSGPSQPNQLVAMASKHVDDIKLAGEPKEVATIVQHIERTFGELKKHYDTFTNCGIRHTRHSDGSITMDQDEYIQALCPITHTELTRTNLHNQASEQLQQLFASLLGAAAYALLAQHNMAVFIVNLQRQKTKLLVRHVRQLNIVVKAMKKQPARIQYPAMKCDRHLVIHSDGSFRKEENTGYGMRGANYLRVGRHAKDNTPCCNLLDSVCRTHKLFC